MPTLQITHLTNADADSTFDAVFFDSITGDLAIEATAFSATRVDFVNTSNATRTGAFTGTGFAFAPSGEPISGTVDGLELRIGGVLQFTLTGLAVGLPTLIDALEQNANGNPAALDALFAEYDFAVDATATTTGVTINSVGDGDDTIDGGSGPDIIEGLGGRDFIVGGAGDDTIFGGEGADFILGGPGNDFIDGGAGDDVIRPGGGFDSETIRASVGSDTIDFLFADTSPDSFYALDYRQLGGTIAINLGTTSGTIAKTADGSTDSLTNLALIPGELNGGLSIRAGAGADTAVFNLAPNEFAEFDGGAGADSMTGGAGFDRLRYRDDGGNGVVVTVTSGPGAAGSMSGTAVDGFGFTDTFTTIDEIRGTNFNDTMTGGASDDRFSLESGHNTVDGGLGFDLLRYDRFGMDRVTLDLVTGTAQTVWNANAFSDTVAGIEWVRGSRAGDDVIRGSAAAERFESLGGNNLFDGRGGSDTLMGGTGEDTLIAGSGDDALTGGAGVDSFVIQSRGGINTITDFDAATEVIRLSGAVGVTAASQVLSFLSKPSADVSRFAFNDGTVLEIEHAAQAGTPLTAANFLIDNKVLAVEDARTVAYLYEAGLNRDGNIDLPGLNFWITQRASGFTEKQLANAFLRSGEFIDAFGDPDVLTDQELVEVLYRNVLNREGEPGGVAFWTEVASRPAFTEADLLLAFAASGENLVGSPNVLTLGQGADGSWDFA